MNLKKELDALTIEPIFCEIVRLPKNHTEIEQDKYDSLEKMIQVLEDNDDVQNVYHNGELVNL